MPSTEIFMQRCIELALRGAGKVSPNPMVGAVLVHNNEIIGEGFHEYYGGAHAEVNCIQSVAADKRSLISESVLYVSLEPCSHVGKTPPCTGLILTHQIKHVVIGSSDPNPLVAGKGISKLRSEGVEVNTGILQAETGELNKRFFCFHQKQRPYVILKWAQTADGLLSKGIGDRLKITGKAVDTIVHKWRTEEDAIMVGRKTALLDDPQLTARYWEGKNPVRIVTDPQASLPETLKLFDQSAPLVVLNYHKDEKAGEVLYKKIQPSGISEILKALKELNIHSVIIEGGEALLNSFLESGLWDEARVITNNALMAQAGLPAPNLPQGSLFDKIAIANEEIVFIKNILSTNN